MEGLIKVISCYLQNFASYKSLEFNFENQGLTLIQGLTGSGKSTLCDAIPWILFGRTAKDGTVDEVISWNAEGTTLGTIELHTHGETIHISRRRGQNANDLYFFKPGNGIDPIRGKDLNDTQKLINNLLGIDLSLYLSGAYFHEFSQTAQFFTTTAKNRRIICEQLVDLSLAKTLQLKLTESRKELNTKSQLYVQKIQSCGERIQYLAKYHDFKEKSENFEKNKNESIEILIKQSAVLHSKIKPEEYFTTAYKELKHAKESLGDTRCAECGGKKNSDAHEELCEMEQVLRREMYENDKYVERLNNIKSSVKKEQSSVNTYEELIIKMEKEIADTNDNLNSYKVLQEANNQQLANHETLLDLIDDLRGITIQNSIKSLEEHTNKLLNDHYDAEIRVLFSVESADKLDVVIYKDGNMCSFTQLSKGQRQLLKLCFGISIMRSAANHYGVSFNAIFIDEALEGLDENMKSRTFGLLQGLSLEYESIFVVDHSEALKACFSNSYKVQLVNGSSVIYEG